MSVTETLIPLEQAYALLKSEFSPKKHSVESLPLLSALGRYVAEAAVCRLDHPAFDQSAMDGIAYPWEPDLEKLQLLGTIAAGDDPQARKVGKGEAVRIMTGAPVPEGADTVAMVEKVVVEGQTVTLTEPGPKGQHIRFCGENMKTGDVLAEVGTRLTPGYLAALVSQGVREVAVRPKLRVGLATTGNEVVPYHQPLMPGQIYNSNAPALEALLRGPDVAFLGLGVLPDNLAQTTACLAHQTDQDVLILTGGVSMGAFDFVPEAAVAAGFKPLFHKVQMKPGKPIWVGRHPKGTWLFGLPGNPVSALVGTSLFVQPLLEALRTGIFTQPRWAHLPIEKDVRNHSKFPFFQGCKLKQMDGELCASPVQTSGSGDILRFGASETLMRIPPASTLQAGAAVEVLLPLHGGIG